MTLSQVFRGALNNKPSRFRETKNKNLYGFFMFYEY